MDPQVSENFQTIRALRMLIKKIQGGKVSISLIRRTITKTALPKNVVTKSIHELQLMEADVHMKRLRYKKSTTLTGKNGFTANSPRCMTEENRSLPQK